MKNLISRPSTQLPAFVPPALVPSGFVSPAFVPSAKEKVYRRIAEASRRLEERSVRSRLEVAVSLYLEAVVACAAGTRFQSVSDCYRQLERNTLQAGNRGMLFSESAFRRHVKRQREAAQAGAGIVIGDFPSLWSLRRMLMKTRPQRR